jgi:hypothetical protein
VICVLACPEAAAVAAAGGTAARTAGAATGSAAIEAEVAAGRGRSASSAGRPGGGGGLATESDLSTVTKHLTSIDALESHPPNAAMISRIRSAMSDGRPLTPGERNFMTHELTEARAMARGVPQDLAHEMAGQTHPLFQNYDPEIIKQYPEYFNSNWRKAWGLP